NPGYVARQWPFGQFQLTGTPTKEVVMKEKSIVLGTPYGVIRITVCLLLVALFACVTGYAAKQVVKYDVHDKTHPRPPVITPAGQPGQPPSDAIILFDGNDLSQWRSGKGEAKWKVEKEDGYMEVNKTGSIRTKKSFGNCQLHIEWATPKIVKGRGQGRGNSGVFFMGIYELQILDSYNNRTYADGQAASIYSQYPPLVNACRGPGQWQSYDVSFVRPIFDGTGKCIRPARITVLHNGVVVHNNVEIKGRTEHKKKAKYRPHSDKGPISLQDHGNPMQFRNIWIRELPEQPYLIAD
ncbi:MAG: DUF1080 domain-containing protein, partial [Desulfobacteraceae bacterium]|nr:DUF1080 domain-containing protein [Desulfobacteraceae bacterium]